MVKPNTYYKNIRPEVAKFLPTEYNKVLEIGCGEGNFKSNLNNKCEYWGIENNEKAGQIAKQNLDKILIGDFFVNYESIPDDYFDLIICNDIIEHLHDHNLFFEIIKKKMKHNAYLVGSIPNVRFYSNLFRLIVHRDWKYENEGILDRTHLRFFTQKSLMRTLEKNNFIIEKINGINGIKFSFFPIRTLLKNILILFLGADTRYMQYGFRIQKNNY